MDAGLTRWDNWSAEQWLEEAARFNKMALRFQHRPQLSASFRALARDALVRAKDGQLTEAQVLRGTHWRYPQRSHPAARPTSSDVEYFRRRTAEEQRAAFQSRDPRVRSVHLEMAERYRALSLKAEMHHAVDLRLVSQQAQGSS